MLDKRNTFIIFLILTISSNASALSIEQAYRAIPHQRTIFNVKKSEMTQNEKDYLIEFYHLVDLAIVERVDMLIYLKNHGRRGSLADNYDIILRQLNALTAPKKLKKAHQLVISAIEEQRSFLNEWKAKGFEEDVNIRSNPKVRRANSKLMQAYNIFMKSYPNEETHNKQAFFDYLCALDFI